MNYIMSILTKPYCQFTILDGILIFVLVVLLIIVGWSVLSIIQKMRSI